MFRAFDVRHIIREARIPAVWEVCGEIVSRPKSQRQGNGLAAVTHERRVGVTHSPTLPLFVSAIGLLTCMFPTKGAPQNYGDEPMSLADRLPEITTTPQRLTCKTCIWLAQQPQRDQEAFEQLAQRNTNQPTFSKSYFHRICRDEGLPASESSFKRHLENCRVPR